VLSSNHENTGRDAQSTATAARRSSSDVSRGARRRRRRPSCPEGGCPGHCNAEAATSMRKASSMPNLIAVGTLPALPGCEARRAVSLSGLAGSLAL
jgi:hypothetical protein